jgi:L-threonylcarbamoyladenylate synthase
MTLAYWDSPSDIVRHLTREYWPGALTIVARCKKNVVYSPVRGGGETIGLRMPNHQDLLEVIKNIGVPLLGPSANFHGALTPFTAAELDPELVKLVDYVMPGACKAKQVSTVIDTSVNPPRIIRQGAVQVTKDLIL